MRLPALCVFLVLVMVFCGCNGGGSKPIALALNFSGTQAIDNGQSLAITVTGAGSKGVMWSLASAGTLSNVTTTSVTYNAPAGPLTAPVTDHLTATSLDDATKTAMLTITDNPVPSITTTSLPAGTEGTAYSQTIAATGGAGTLTFSLSVGTLPAGLTMSSGGAITGTPTGPNGTASFTVKVTDSSVGSTGPQSNTQALSILINLPPPPSITTTSLPNATEGTAYNQTVAATGGLTPYTFTISSAGGLPAGLSMDTSGHITGTPTGPNGTSNFTVKVTDSSNPKQSATQNLSITVNLPTPPSITTSSLPAGVEGTAYTQTIAATGGIPPYTFAVTGTLPPGLSMDTSGNITGTPTGPNGTTSFTVTVTDKSNPPQTGSKGLSITINLPPAPTISPTTLPNGNVGTPYSQTLTVSGGLGPFTWAVSSGTLPAGLVLTANSPTTTAKISGTPTTAQSNVAFTIQVTDTSNPPQTGQQAYTVTINPPAPLSITTTSPLPNGAFNTAYSTTINATGGVAPYTFSLDPTSSPLPAGLSFTNDAVNNQGKISGTPTTAGMFTNIIVDVHDSQVPTAATATKTFTLTITATAVVVSPASGALPSATVNTAYTTNITATGGVTPYTFSLDATSAALPAGLTFTSNSTTGTISGTPTATGTTNGIIVDVKDSESPPMTVKVTYSITVNASAAACGSGSESLLNGGYAFLVKGFDNASPAQPVLIGGVLTFNGIGSITAATSAIDMNLSSGVQSPTVLSGTYSAGLDTGGGYRGCMTITTNSATNPTQTYRFSLGNISGTPAVASTGHVIGFDTAGPFTSGIMRKQSGGPFSNASVNGTFTFGGSSLQNTSKCPAGVAICKFGIIGVITFNGLGGITGGSEDINFNGFIDGSSTSGGTWPASSPITFSSASSYNIAANGRGSETVAITGTALAFHSFIYGVSSSEAFFMSSDSQTAAGINISAGQAFLQSGGPFSLTSLNGSYIGYDTALGTSGGTTAAEIFLVNPTGNGNLTITIQQNKGGTITSQSNAPGTYNVTDMNLGRVFVTLGGKHDTLLYLVSTSKAFLLNDNGRVSFGFVELQSGSPFSSSSASGTYAFGTIDPQDSAESDNSGVATFTSPNVSGTSDSNSSGSQSPNSSFGPTPYSVDSTGLGVIPSGCTIGGAGLAGCQLAFYIISPTKAAIVELQSNSGTNKTNPALQVADK